jgi:hypothetical protein
MPKSECVNTNIYQPGGVDTIAISVAVLEKLYAKEVSESGIKLFLLLVKNAEMPTVFSHSSELMKSLKMSRPTLRHAREELVAKGFIKCRETWRQGMWEFELLGANGGKLPVSDMWVVFRDQTPEAIERFYSDRLNVPKAPATDETGALLFECPFHLDTKQSLQVTIGGDYHGMWYCADNRRCGKHGGLIQLEQMLFKQRHRRKLHQRDAAQSVRSFFWGLELFAEQPQAAVEPLPEGAFAPPQSARVPGSPVRYAAPGEVSAI